MPSRAERYREKAKDCAAVAAAVTDRVLRFELQQVARQWLQLADQVELLDRLASN
jgi:hypothetical protein